MMTLTIERKDPRPMPQILPRESCRRCGHKWVKRVERPRVCPRCKSPWFDVAKPVKRGRRAKAVV